MSLRPVASVGSVPLWKLRRWLPVSLAAALGIGGPVTWALAQPPALAPDWQHVSAQPPAAPVLAKIDDKKPADPKKTEEPKKDPLAAERTISVNFDGAQWSEVLEWYSKESGLILSTTVKPTGNVTIKPPGVGRKFSLAEVTDLLNESMVVQKFILIRYNTTFTIWPVDEKLDYTLIPGVTPAELPRRGKTELVKCVIGPFKTFSSADIRPEIEAMLTPFGKAQLLERSNSFQITDKAGNIARIKQVLDDQENSGDAGMWTHTCKYKKAREVAGYLEKLLKDKDTTVESSAPPAAMSPYSYPAFGQPGFSGGFPGQGGGFRDRGFGSGGGFDRNNPLGGAGSARANSGTKSVQIAVDDSKNSIMITAPEDKIVQAKKFVEDNDKPQYEGQQPIVVTPPVLKTYSVPAGTANDTAKAIGAQYPWINVTPIAASNQIMVVASADDHKRVSDVLTGGNPQGPAGESVAKIIPIFQSDTKELAAILSKSFTSSTAGGPIIEAQSGGIYFSGTSDDYAKALKIIQAFEGPAGGFEPGKGKIQFNLEGGSAGILAEALAERLAKSMKGMNKNPVIINNLTGNPVVPQKSPGSTTPAAPRSGSGLNIPPMAPPTPLPGERKSELPAGPRDPRYVLAQLVDPDSKSNLKPVIITVIGNKLTIESEDPVALQLINDLLRFYVQQGTKPDENLFEVVKLKYVAAEDAAKVVTEIFNGPQQQQGGGGNRGGGLNPINLIGGLLGSAAPSGPPAPGRVRVVAEKSSNSLVVVKASPLDFFTIKKLLANVIDSGETDSDAIQRTHVIRLKNTDASDMATQLKDLYKPYLTGTGGSTGPALPFPFGPQGNQQNNNSKPPALTISTDDRTNSVLLLCTNTLYEEVREVVQMLDSAVAADNTEVLRAVPIRGIDPALVQQMVDAIQGKDPNAMTRGGLGGLGGNRGGLGGGGIPGLGGGGFPGLGGGGFPGGGFGRGGGGFPGGGLGGGNFGGGGGGNRGMGGGGGGNRGGGGGGNRGGRQANLGTEGPLNFDYRDMDVPSALTSTIFDPETDTNSNLISADYVRPAPTRRKLSEILQAGAHQPVPGGFQPPSQPMVPPSVGGPPPQPGIGVSAPSGAVTAIPISEAGVVFVRTTNPRDMEIVLELIEFLRKQAEGTEPELRLVPLKYQDCNTVAGTLNSIFARVQVGQTANIVPQAARQVNVGNLLAGSGAPSPTQNVYCVAMPRFNSLLIAGPKGRFADIVREVERIDQPNEKAVQVKAIQLKKASAQVIALQLRQLYSQRFPSEGPPSMLFRVNFDLPSNSVLVTASPADMKDIEDLVAKLDSTFSASVNDVRIFQLRNAFADEVATLLIQAISANVVSPLAQTQQPWYTQTVTTGNIGNLGGIQALLGQGVPGQGQQQLGQQLGQQFGQQLGQQLAPGSAGQGNNAAAINLNATANQVGSAAGGGLTTKTNALRFFSSRDGQVVETGYLEDVHVVPYPRTNAILVAAKPETMKLIEKLLENLDTTAAARAYINIFTLKNADAVLTGITLQQLFTGAQRTSLTPGGATATAGAAPTGATTAARPILTLFDTVAPGAQLIDLRISIDDRTNSLIVAGSLNDLETIRSIIARLESAPTESRQFDVYKLRNASAADVATSLTSFLTTSLGVYSGAQFLSAYQQLQRNVVVVAEPISNTIMISATPQYFNELRRIIERIDAQPPQVVIQVIIADVQLTNNEEIGVEFGVQSPVLFARSGGAGSTPGFNFNSTGALPNAAVVSPSVVGYQGLGNLGVGRSSSTGGGFIFSAQSDAFSMLIRALKVQGRIDILSRPQIHVTDNQVGYVQIGQTYPTPSTSTLTATGAAQTGVAYVPVGVTLRVTPRINPDGKVLMRVEPQVSNVAPGTVAIGPGINAPIINNETVETTVLAADGETIVIGGLISKTDSRTETGIPFVKDIPYIGSLFRYRQQGVTRREVLFIMTPHIVRSEYDTARILAEESRRINWCLPDIAKMHGHGLEVMGPAAQGANPVPVGGTLPGTIPPGQLPAAFSPGFLSPNPVPGPGPDTPPIVPQIPGGAMLPPQTGPGIGQASTTGPVSNATPQMLPSSAPGSGVPILNANGTLTPASAVVYSGSTPYVMPGGAPPVLAMTPNGAVPLGGPTAPAKNGYLMALPPRVQLDVPAAESKAPRGKEDRPWGVFNK